MLRLSAFLILAAALVAPISSAERGASERFGPDSGSGTLDAFGPDGAPLGDCPLEHTDVSAEISGFAARIVVTQTFRNPHPDPVEAIYTFPLGEHAAVDAMWMRTGGRTIRGEIDRREDARRRYEEARARGQLTGLLDEERPNIFTQSLANLMPGATVEIEIHYVETLDYEAGAFEFAFPTVVGPRFVPGAPIGRSGGGFAPDTTRVPDGSRITPPVTPEGTRAGHDISIRVDIDAGVPIHAIDSKLHRIDVERPDSARARVSLRRRSEIPNRDFVLRWEVAADQVQSTVLSHRDGDGDGYATFVLLPPRRVTARTAAPKELVFVVDRSGSQSGRPLAKAKETLHWILDHMNPNDTFQIVDFGSRANQLFERPMPASLAMKQRARRHIDALSANGGTYMAEAIQKVVSMPADGNRLRIVTFMTDGYVGNDFEVLSLVRRLRGTSRWFPFGTGNSVNRFLLDQMAIEGGGEVEYVLLDSSGEDVAKRFWDKISSPALTDVRLEFRGLDVVDMHPNELSDVWAERPLIVHARYRQPGRGRVILHGYRQGRPWREELRVTLPEREERGAALASLWARARVESLMRRDFAGLQSGTYPDSLKEQIVEIALAHSILTPFTSFVAVEDRVVNESGILRTETVPVEMPQGVEYDGVFGNDARHGAVAQAKTSSRGRFASGMSLLQALPAPMAEREEMRAFDRSDAEALKAPAPAEPRVLSKKAERKLEPRLQRLVAQGSGSPADLDVVGDEVKVEMTLRDTSQVTLRALEALGVRILSVTDSRVVARVPTRLLAALAEREEVERIEPV